MISLASSNKIYIPITEPSVMLENISVISLAPSYVVFKPGNILKIYIPITEPSASNVREFLNNKSSTL